MKFLISRGFALVLSVMCLSATNGICESSHGRHTSKSNNFTAKVVKLVIEQIVKSGITGPTGVAGKDGAPGKDGVDGKDGAAGENGVDGKDGSPDTPLQILAKLLTVDGSGSGLDADTLDGMSAKQIADLSSFNSSAILFTHWGHKGCPNGADLVYSGIAAGSHFRDSGSGSNVLCLRVDPVFDDSVVNRGGAGGIQDGANIYGFEYETGRYDPPGLAAQVDQKVACAVCVRNGAKVVFMQPGRNDCPDSFAPEYDGYLMSSQFSDYKSEFICVDKLAQGYAHEKSTTGGYDTALLYPAQIKCGIMGCAEGEYINNREVTCSVCSK